MSTTLRVSAHENITSDEDWKTYASCVSFMAYWFEKQNGANGKETPELFDEFKENVCEIMVGDAVKGD